MVITKKCSGECGLEKPLECFYEGKNKCKDCILEGQKEFYQKNKEKISISQKEYREENKEKISEQRKECYQKNKDGKIKEYNEEHKEEKTEYDKKYREGHKEEKSAYNKKYYEEYKDQLLVNIKEYQEENKEKVAENKKEYEKERRKNDPIYRFRHSISNSILFALKFYSSSKNGYSIEDFLPVSIPEMWNHIESQFEPWMTRENQGVYRAAEWDDNDSTTWKWQLDHIIPHSEFHYETMDCEEFRACWDLSNLRPYSAKQNVIDGANRMRHAK